MARDHRSDSTRRAFEAMHKEAIREVAISLVYVAAAIGAIVGITLLL